MQNEPSSPSAPPARGFASILTLTSNIAPMLKAVEEAASEFPAEASARPRPVRIGPSTPEPTRSPSYATQKASSTDSSGGIPWGWIIVVIVVVVRLAACLG